jgi:hypothetical protein
MGAASALGPTRSTFQSVRTPVFRRSHPTARTLLAGASSGCGTGLPTRAPVAHGSGDPCHDATGGRCAVTADDRFPEKAALFLGKLITNARFLRRVRLVTCSTRCSLAWQANRMPPQCQSAGTCQRLTPIRPAHARTRRGNFRRRHSFGGHGCRPRPLSGGLCLRGESAGRRAKANDLVRRDSPTLLPAF